MLLIYLKKKTYYWIREIRSHTFCRDQLLLLSFPRVSLSIGCRYYIVTVTEGGDTLMSHKRQTQNYVTRYIYRNIGFRLIFIFYIRRNRTQSNKKTKPKTNGHTTNVVRNGSDDVEHVALKHCRRARTSANLPERFCPTPLFDAINGGILCRLVSGIDPSLIQDTTIGPI